MKIKGFVSGGNTFIPVSFVRSLEAAICAEKADRIIEIADRRINMDINK